MAKAPKKPAVIKWTRETTRFAECLDCKFFKPFHADKACNGCEIGENFEEVIEELDPYALRFLSRKSR